MKKYLSDDFKLSDYVEVADECCIWSAPFGLKLLEYIEYKKGLTALDIGFGTGFPLTEIALRLGESSTIYGIDPWKEAIEKALKKIEYYRLANVRLIEGFAESIPLSNSSVDLIVSNNGLNNVSDMDLVINECARVMKSKGQFVMTMNLDKSMHEFYDQLERVLSEMNLQNEIGLMKSHIKEKRRPVNEVILSLEKNGFEMKDVVTDQFSYKFADGTAMLNHYFIRLAFMHSWLKIVPANLTEKIFEKIETRLNSKADEEGGMKLSIPFVLINARKRL
jgi:ubiquinone/menaquinone biosynthesis C-methylase UbiE